MTNHGLRPMLIGCCACAALAILPATVRAGSGVTDTSHLALVGGTVFVRIYGPWAGLNMRQRVDKVQERVNGSLSVGPVYPTDISVGQVQGDWCVLFKGRRFLTADNTAARVNHVSPRALAIRWALRMRQIIPALTRPTNPKP